MLQKNCSSTYISIECKNNLYHTLLNYSTQYIIIYYIGVISCNGAFVSLLSSGLTSILGTGSIVQFLWMEQLVGVALHIVGVAYIIVHGHMVFTCN